MRHQIYFSSTDIRERVPPLEIGLFLMHVDAPEEVYAAGYAYGKWLLTNASGTWSKGMRKAFEDNRTMQKREEEDDDESGK